MAIFRFACRAQPTCNNPKYATWQPADVVAFISGTDGPSAEKEFLEFLERLHWRMLSWKLRDELIEDRIRQVGGEVLDAYVMAQKRGRWYKIVPEHFMAEKLARGPMAPPRPDEAFVDRIILHSGGRRPTIEERAHDSEPNADYILDEFILELKDLQEERISKFEVRERLAELFWSYFEEDAVVPLDPRILKDADWNEYVEILAQPVRKHIRKAAAQVKATIARFKISGWRGGVILLNTGFASLDHDLFERIVGETMREFKVIELAICITAQAHTNGFDSISNWRFSPKEPKIEVAKKIFASYDIVLSEMMGTWARSGFHTPVNHQPILEPVSFVYGGKTFTWDPGSLPFSFERKR